MVWYLLGGLCSKYLRFKGESWAVPGGGRMVLSAVDAFICSVAGAMCLPATIRTQKDFGSALVLSMPISLALKAPAWTGNVPLDVADRPANDDLGRQRAGVKRDDVDVGLLGRSILFFGYSVHINCLVLFQPSQNFLIRKPWLVVVPYGSFGLI